MSTAKLPHQTKCTDMDAAKPLGLLKRKFIFKKRQVRKTQTLFTFLRQVMRVKNRGWRGSRARQMTGGTMEEGGAEATLAGLVIAQICKVTKLDRLNLKYVLNQDENMFFCTLKLA